ncbi:winged helix-turn-helix transcriptional regulator [Arthrobacter sp. TMN-37]
MAQRSYDDSCGAALAMDAVGERWSMLVVRELLLGPKRFSDLRAGLPNASPNVLSQRLKDLEAQGLLRRVKLGPPASVSAYELTDSGRQLEPVLIELSRWGSRIAHRPLNGMSTDSFMLMLKALYYPPKGSAFAARIRLRPDWDRFTVVVTPQAIEVSRSAEGSVDVDVDGDVLALWDLIFNGETVPDAVAAGRITVTGDAGLAAGFFPLFSVAPPAVPPLAPLAG